MGVPSRRPRALSPWLAQLRGRGTPSLSDQVLRVAESQQTCTATFSWEARSPPTTSTRGPTSLFMARAILMLLRASRLTTGPAQLYVMALRVRPTFATVARGAICSTCRQSPSEGQVVIGAWLVRDRRATLVFGGVRCLAVLSSSRVLHPLTC